MRNSLINKANKIISEGKIVKSVETSDSVEFRITPSKYQANEELLEEEYYWVNLKYEDYVLKHSCTCKLMSMKNPNLLCSHKIAGIIMWAKVQNE